MGMVYAEVELINAGDIELAKRHFIDEEEVRSMRVTMLADSGAYLMGVNESMRDYLGLRVIEKSRPMQLANGEWVVHDIVGPITARYEGREALCNAALLPGDSEPLLGAIPMEIMDVLIHPQRQELVVNPKNLEGGRWRLGGLRPL